ncbi:hypothetical protein [Rhodoferax aquaticus]|uniref:Glycosyl hydrolase family 32 N-terminal domain-containing protein n=1 Tax=Rhodoferax aquaticus TaxID=2527691 RepID=A0A515EP60_9BURK|nr:hypothetical protein [Rhodoferax aquaticus]QDL54441.1 hypothetical protein EXZ61_09855 [Rhodoferax aquaticus]
MNQIKRWCKNGLIYAPGSGERHFKLVSHAANPIAVHLEADIFRIFYSGRDRENRSTVGSVDIDIVAKKVIAEDFFPKFEHGPTGSFYSHGVSIGNCYFAGGTHYMLFMGWQRPDNAHWRGDIGRLIVGADHSLQLDSPSVFMGVDSTDPMSLSYPWVLTGCGGMYPYRMWYGSTLTWNAGNDEMIHVINSAVSCDGHFWERRGLALPFAVGTAQAFSRPSVLRNLDGSYEMWFSYRSGSGTKYKIGYAHSGNGDQWQLDLDNVGLDVSPTGWDSEMIEYPYVFDHNGTRYMLYNGNGFGASGFGLATLYRN